MRHFKNIITAVALGFGLVSCTGKFEEINTNPNKNTVGTVQAYNLFEPILYSTGKWSTRFAYTYAGPISGQFANTKNFTSTAYIHQWNLTDSHFQTVWDNNARYGYDCQHMIETAVKYNDTYYEALGYIFKVYHLSNLATLFGDIPYAEAYKGPSEGLKTPKFDSQPEVFAQMFDELDYAVSLLKENPIPSTGGLDKMYNDKCSLWIKYANSLKVKLLHRIANVDENAWAKIQEIVNDPAEYPVFESIEEQAMVPFSGVDPYQAYFSTGTETAESFKNYKLSEEVVGMLYDFDKKYADPRLYIFGLKNGSEWKGTVPGTADSDLNIVDKNSANLNTNTLNRNNAPGRLLEYSEILFIYAEGVLKGKLQMPMSAKYYYEEAIRASVKSWADYAAYNEVKADEDPIAYDDAAIDALLASKLASYDAVKAGTSPYATEEELILSQKWLSLIWNGFEAYNEWRRNEYPIIHIADGTVINNYEMPTRFAYPLTVRTSNSVNMHEALERMGGDNNMHTALWWSYKALNNGSRPEHVRNN